MFTAKSWRQSDNEKKQNMLSDFWKAHVANFNMLIVVSVRAAVKEIPNYSTATPAKWSERVDKIFNEVVMLQEDDRIDEFYRLFDHILPVKLTEVLGGSSAEAGKAQGPEEEVLSDSRELCLDKLRQYLHDNDMSGTVAIYINRSELFSVSSANVRSESAFAIYSIGKIFTGILLFQLIREGIIDEKHLHEKLKIDPEVLAQLPIKIQKRLDEVTLYQVMTHYAGLSDYTPQLIRMIVQAKQQGKPVPAINRIVDIVKLGLIRDETCNLGEFNYTNLAFLLVGLHIEYAYSLKFNVCKSFNDILHQYVVTQAGMLPLSRTMPIGAQYSEGDIVAPHVSGGPAGGYWTTASNLVQFGRWLYQQTLNDPKLKALIEAYGQEFYQPSSNLIVHYGDTPSASTQFSVSLRSGDVITVLSDQPDVAKQLEEIIRHRVVPVLKAPLVKTAGVTLAKSTNRLTHT